MKTSDAARKRLERIRNNKQDRCFAGRFSKKWMRLFDKANRRQRNRDYYFYQSIPF